MSQFNFQEIRGDAELQSITVDYDAVVLSIGTSHVSQFDPRFEGNKDIIGYFHRS